MSPLQQSLSVLLFLSCAFQYGTCKYKYFDEVPKELRCSGCELTVKVINRMLTKTKPSQAEEFVDLVLKEVCEEKRFEISEYKSDYMVKTCKFMLDFHGDELRGELIKYYRKSKKSTYVELSQQICLNIMRLCPGMAHRMPDHHNDPSGGHFHHFMEVSGLDAKVAQPVAAHTSHDEL